MPARDNTDEWAASCEDRTKADAEVRFAWLANGKTGVGMTKWTRKGSPLGARGNPPVDLNAVAHTAYLAVVSVRL